jgi:hypothetical protein
VKRLESYSENQTVAWARRRGVLTTKLKIEGQAGWPDRAFWLPGAPVIIEFKRRGKKPRKLQVYIMNKLRALGYDVIWTDNEETAINYLEARLPSTQTP